MADIMELDNSYVEKTDDNSYVEKTDEVVMPNPSDDEKNEPWCLECSFKAGEPRRTPCNHPPDEATRTFESTSEDDRKRICRRISTLASQMDYLFDQILGQTPPDFPVTREIKYQQQLLHIKLLAVLLYTNQIGGQDDRDSLGLWVRLDTELDAEPDYQRLVPHDVVTEAISSHSTEA
ncbi:uncharacterized protein BBA_00056 [Beauveria bassiana ARSEF 2860]|uniref:Uncharacterized protein n=1 Tax=Beauveria bassiana (strain ARSEF 2860) TaxID=655819 RepID=J5K8I6_BEAB2|nr:uncharacterized protein BBA_00056 [Beauveria bassiana ARSEF 2860]EJP70426.1 hypothetical protein BBA_00056 [Beauveria bassiana ARSEF 2860]